jgi:hypothetical protein
LRGVDHPRQQNAVLHLGNRLDAKIQFLAVEPRADLPLAGLIASANDATVEDAGSIRPVQKEGGRLCPQPIEIARSCGNRSGGSNCKSCLPRWIARGSIDAVTLPSGGV